MTNHLINVLDDDSREREDKTMKQTVIIREGDQYIGRFDHDSAPNAFIRRLVDVALKYGEAEDEDEDGITVTATRDDEDLDLCEDNAAAEVLSDGLWWYGAELEDS